MYLAPYYLMVYKTFYFAQKCSKSTEDGHHLQTSISIKLITIHFTFIILKLLLTHSYKPGIKT